MVYVIYIIAILLGTLVSWVSLLIIVPIARKQITGKGIQGYIDALEILVTGSKESK